MQPIPAPRLRGRIVLSPKSKKHFASVLVCHDETRKDRFRIHEIVDFFRIITDHVWWLDASPDRSRQPPSRGPRSSAPRRRRSVRFPAKWRMKNGLNFPPNFERLVLGCIDADFCKKIVVYKALDEIRKIYTLSHRSVFERSSTFRQIFLQFCSLIVFRRFFAVVHCWCPKLPNCDEFVSEFILTFLQNWSTSPRLSSFLTFRNEFFWV